MGEIDSIKSRHDALASTHDAMACRQDKMAESLSDIQAALASLNASVSDVAATVGKIAQGDGAEKGGGGEALRRSLAVDSFLRSTPHTQHAQENADVLSEFQTETITNLGDLANLEAGAEAGDVTASSSSSNTEWERAREVLSSTMSRRAPQQDTSANSTRGVGGPARDTETHHQGAGPARARMVLVDQRHLLSDERYDV